jgi:Tol biopolymer transport system component/DNA-binding winged helix-turn-helix (wHTH) protein
MPGLVSSQARFGPFTFDVRTGELHKGGTRIKVPDQSIEILRTLLERPGELITREELRQRLWPDNTYVDFEHGLNAAVRRLRDVLGDSADAPRYIETLPRRGYRFVEAVLEVPAGPGAPNGIRDALEPIEAPKPKPLLAWRERVAWIAVAMLTVVVIALVAIMAGRRPPVELRAEPVRFAIALPEGVTVPADSSFAVSPDGRHLAFVASLKGMRALWLKPMSNAVPERLEGTDGATHPFWSPEGTRVGFFAAKKLKMIPIGGRTPIEICDAPEGRGGTWNQQEEIVFAPSTDTALERVTLSDRRPVPITTRTHGDTTHRMPWFLPDGRHFLYWAGGGTRRNRLQIGSLDSAEPEELAIESEKYGVAYSGGHVLFLQSGNLMAQRFDPSSRGLVGDAFSAADGRTANFSVSTTGVLAVQGFTDSKLTAVDRSGVRTQIRDETTFMVGLSPDDRFVATSTADDVYIVDLIRGARPRLTFDERMDVFPVWGPDSDSVVFTSTRNGRYQLFRTSRNTSGKEQWLYDDPKAAIVVATDWSRDGRFLAFTKSGPATPSIWIRPMTSDAKAFQFHDALAAQANAHFSPDGLWIAFTSDAGKGKEVHVAPFPGPGPAQQVSIGGGTQPLWRADGSELFFLAPDGSMMSAAVVKGRQLEIREPRSLFTVPVNLTVGHGNEYGVSEDGQKFYVNVLDPTPPITVTVNSSWMRTTRGLP